MAISVSRPSMRQAGASRHRAAAGGPRRLATATLVFAVVGSVLTLLVVGALLTYGAIHDDRTYAGVSIAGQDVGGKTEAEVDALLAERFNAFLNTPITFETDAGTFAFTPAQLGVTYDTQAMAERAYAFGRSGTLWTDSRHWLDALAGGYDVPLAFSFDADAFQRRVGDQVALLTRAPVNPEFEQAGSGEVSVIPGVPGIAFDINSARATLVERASALSTAPIAVTTTEIQPNVADQTLQSAIDQMNRLAGGTLTLSVDGGQSWLINQHDLYDMLHIELSGASATVTLDRNALVENLRSISRSVYLPATDAAISNDNGQFTTVQAVSGHRLDIAASADAIIASLEAGNRNVALVTQPVGPHVTDADVAAAQQQALTLSSQSLNVLWDSGSQTIDPQRLAEAVRFNVTPDRNPRITVTFDAEAMRRALGLVSYHVKVEPVDAELRWFNGQIEVRRNETPGRELDLNATIIAVEQALATGSTEVAAVTKDVQPAVTAGMAGSIQIREKLSSGTTYYGNSVSNRLHNVELATARANGALIPPGGVFSFNGAVGEVSTNSGYRTGYGIVGTSNGAISTIPSVGGGICQVATTVFQAAFRAGMPIVERNWHLYWIPRYGQPPSGMQGLDATVDPDYGLDFQFRNGTNDWLAVVSYYDGANTTFELWGTNPGWEVQIDQPVITNVVPASQEMVYEENDQLPAGQTVYVEHAEDGFDAAIHRVVRKDGQVVDEVTMYSTYAPARNVTLVGTG